MRLRLAILLSAVSLGVAAQTFFVLRNPGITAMLGGTSAGGGSLPGPSYLASLDFDDGSTPSGWSVSGSPVFNYADSPAPLAGTYSYYSTNTAYAYNYTIGEVAPGNDVWVFWRMVIKTVGSSSFNCAGVGLVWTNQFNATATFLGGTSNQTVRAAHGSVLTYSADTNLWHYDSEFFVWMRWNGGTGSDGEVDIYINTNDMTRPATPVVSITTGDRMWVWTGSRIGPATSGGSHIIDTVRFSTNVIGDNPE